MTSADAAVGVLADELGALGWVSDLWVAGSLATGDHVHGVSDLDLVAVVDALDDARVAQLVVIHRVLDASVAAGLDLGCVYVPGCLLEDARAEHPTWTHGRLVHRILSGVTRAELVLHGFAVLGRAPAEALAPMGAADVRRAAYDEVRGYWAWAARRPWMWTDPVIADLGLTSMARARHALATGTLLTKSDAVEVARAPRWLRDQLRARRRGGTVTSPRLPTAVIAWVDAVRTVRAARWG